MLVIQFYEENIEKRELLLDAIKEEFPQITSLQYVINEKANDTLYDQDIILHEGKDHIYEKMEGLRFKIGPKSFTKPILNKPMNCIKLLENLLD